MATGVAAGVENSNTSHMESKRIMEGPLCKWTNVVHGWQYRWFVLDKVAGLLSYYTVRHGTAGTYACVCVKPCLRAQWAKPNKVGQDNDKWCMLFLLSETPAADVFVNCVTQMHAYV